jgi:hypothetical protein
MKRRCALCVLFNDSGTRQDNIAWVIDELMLMGFNSAFKGLMLMIINGTILAGEN